MAQTGGMVPAFKAIRGALHGNDTQLKALIGSAEGFNAVIGLLTSQNPAFLETLADMARGNNKVDEAFRKNSAGMQAQMKMLKNSWGVDQDFPRPGDGAVRHRGGRQAGEAG